MFLLDFILGLSETALMHSFMLCDLPVRYWAIPVGFLSICLALTGNNHKKYKPT